MHTHGDRVCSEIRPSTLTRHRNREPASKDHAMAEFPPPSGFRQVIDAATGASIPAIAELLGHWEMTSDVAG
jgi:hypothetical protein